jgi:hypothetical protein
MRRVRFSLVTLLTATVTVAALLFVNLRTHAESYVQLHRTVSPATQVAFRMIDGKCERATVPAQRINMFARRRQCDDRGWPFGILRWELAQPSASSDINDALNGKSFLILVGSLKIPATPDEPLLPEAQFLKKWPQAAGKIIDLDARATYIMPPPNFTHLALNAAIALLILAAVTILAEFLQRRRSRPVSLDGAPA